MSNAKRRSRAFIYAVIVFIVSVILLYLFSQSLWIKRMKYPLDYVEYIEKYSADYSLDPHLVASVIWVESKYRPDAVSRRDARGLMQVTPSTAQWGAEKMGIINYDDAKLFDPDLNISIGCWYLSYLYNQFPENTQLVLASYNGGIGNVKKWLQDANYSTDGQSLIHIPFKETSDYVAIVTESYKMYKKIYPKLGVSPN